MGFPTMYKMNGQVFTRVLGVVILATLAATGCGGGSPGSSTVPTTDLHGDSPLTATRIIVDGPPVLGAIQAKPGGDVDWFRFSITEGMMYCIQFSGIPVPGAPEESMNDEPGFNLHAVQLRQVNGEQEFNSTGGDAGSPYDQNPLGITPGEGFTIIIGDGRIYFPGAFTGDLLLVLRHVDFFNKGNYAFTISSVFSADTIHNRSGRFRRGTDIDFTISDDMGVIQYTGSALGTVGFLGGYALRLEPGATPADAPTWIFSRGGFVASIVLSVNPEVADPTLPTDALFQFHLGTPSMVEAKDSLNALPPTPDTPDPGVIDVSLPYPMARRSFNADEPVLLKARLSDGTEFEVEATLEGDDVVTRAGLRRISMTAHISGDELAAKAAAAQRGAIIVTGASGTPDAGFDFGGLRTLAGFPFYSDVHWSSDPLESPLPTAVSFPFDDSYSMFESELEMSSANVVVRNEAGAIEQPLNLRGLATGQRPLYYDASLQAFQIIFRTYDEASSALIPDDFPDLAGSKIQVHAGGPGQVGPVIIDLGTVPASQTMPEFTVLPGFRNVIKQLNAAEVSILRNAFYTTGFYVQISNPAFPAGFMRAEGDLNIQLFPSDGTVRNGRAVSRGSVAFTSDYAQGGSVTVVCNGKLLGSITEFSDGATSPCLEASSSSTLVSKLYPAEEYYWRAFAEDGREWEGTLDMAEAGCETVVLSVE